MYTPAEKTASLKALITSQLLPLLKAVPCVYMDLPYHANIGDTLIWEGTEQFIADNHIKCLYRCSIHTYFYKKLPPHVIILLHGGGNFGDTWRQHQEFRLTVIRDYPNNPIIILPQTVYYADQDKMRADACKMAEHPNLTICARDELSHRTLKTFFSAHRLLLLPDMAFCIAPEKLMKQTERVCPTEKTLLVKRTDKELSTLHLSTVSQDTDHTDVRDWPSLEKQPGYLRYFYTLSTLCHMAGNFTHALADSYAYHIIRPKLIDTGIRFVAPYKQIYTTRLHVAILATLLHKPFTFIDNSYGKNSGFYDTWLSDLEGGQFIKQK